MSLSADFLATEARLITRVRALLPAWPARAVMGAADMAGVQDLGQFAPAVFVVYAGTQLEQGQSGGVLLWGAGALRQLLQQWRVVLQLRNAQGAALGDGLRTSAGPLLATLCAGLSGYVPPEAPTDIYQLAAVPAPEIDASLARYFIDLQCSVVW